ncbi:hypothetical protein [Leptospira kmetyi]|uniref:DUF2007 domain-containing protein n=1 Tax=Leptospira kmetyi TaxID=408139 RepID=A0A2M9XLY4_9LEPT|nr:hypothetical protein [Leptospira kmetyi]AYV56714.1 hypothetical protein EFP84_15230 [Leptospira kmetyi]EQA52008.1 hypothetical protein LEP1GSC052_2253 [Leptospira kmetyi serovar Malaysia str. Bejo-Iso9]PJZ31203.1 hypothetical protein CH378_03110 [Leptospira kmetyi]PJZ40273.1 hypothetical protein CH370_17335 [Leptospira kmetyi]TGK18281.1 hypothetical protein EHO62_07485 [Leptospira kmetyi]
MEPFERNQEENEDDFSARWETSDPMLLSIVKSFLDAQEIHYFVVGEELFFLEGAAVPAGNHSAILYMGERDYPILLEFLEREHR